MTVFAFDAIRTRGRDIDVVGLPGISFPTAIVSRSSATFDGFVNANGLAGGVDSRREGRFSVAGNGDFTMNGLIVSSNGVRLRKTDTDTLAINGDLSATGLLPIDLNNGTLDLNTSGHAFLSTRTGTKLTGSSQLQGALINAGLAPWTDGKLFKYNGLRSNTVFSRCILSQSNWCKSPIRAGRLA